jgi:hydroxymethylglutaryl-CoA synthase
VNSVDRGIISWGAYIPRLRLDRKTVVDANRWANGALAGRAAGTRSFCNWDEDSVTMGVEAARVALARTNTVPERIVFASNTAPFDDRPASVIAAQALQLPAAIQSIDQGRTQRAGTSALIDALSSSRQSLVIASDTRHGSPGTVQELAYGDAAAALSIGSGDTNGGVVARCLGSVSRTEDFVDHFRAAGETGELHWEERWVRDEGIGKFVPVTIKALLQQTGVDAAAINHFIFPTTFAKLSEQMAARVGIDKAAVRDDLAASVGESGCAHALLMLAATLDIAKPGEKILVVSFANGCDAILLEATPAITKLQGQATVSALVANSAVEKSYQKFLSFKGEVNIDFGLRFEAEVKTTLTGQYRRGREFAAFQAGKCPKCSTVQFPRAGVCINPDCEHIGEQSLVSLLGVPGKIVSFTSDWLSFKGAPPFCFGLVQFDNGARVLMEFSDFTAEQLQIDAPIRAVYRRKEVDKQRHYHSYFWKAAPAQLGEEK